MAHFGDIDELERAASAFPALEDDLDGFSSGPAAPAPLTTLSSAPLDFDFDPLPASNAPPVKITGDDEIEKFENQFPDIGGEVSSRRVFGI